MGTIEQEIAQLSRELKARAGGGPAKAVADTGSIMLSLNKFANTNTLAQEKLQHQVSLQAVRDNLNRLNRLEDQKDRDAYNESKTLDTREYNESLWNQRKTERKKEDELELIEKRKYDEEKYETRLEESRVNRNKIYTERLKETRGYAKDLAAETAFFEAEEQYLKTIGGDLKTWEDVESGTTDLIDFESRYMDIIGDNGEILQEGNKALMVAAKIQFGKIEAARNFLHRKDASLQDMDRTIQEFDMLRGEEASSGNYIFSDVHETDLRDTVRNLQDRYAAAEELGYVSATGRYNDDIENLSEYVKLRGALKRMDDDLKTAEFDIPADLSAITLPEDEWLRLPSGDVMSSAEDALRQSLSILSNPSGDLKEAARLLEVSNVARRRSIEQRHSELIAGNKQQIALANAKMNTQIKSFNNRLNVTMSEEDAKFGIYAEWLKNRSTEGLFNMNQYDTEYALGLPNKITLSNTTYKELSEQTAASLLTTLAVSSKTGGAFVSKFKDNMNAGTWQVDDVIARWFESGHRSVEASDIVNAIKSRQRDFKYGGTVYDFTDAKQWPGVFSQLDLEGDKEAENIQAGYLHAVWNVFELLESHGPIMENLAEMQASSGYTGSDITMQFIEDYPNR